jgi:hypothetical protein
MTSEPLTLHMSYLNGDYASDAVSTWQSGGCYDEIRRKLGYRFEVTAWSTRRQLPPGKSFTVRIDIANSGWARLHRPQLRTRGHVGG